MDLKPIFADILIYPSELQPFLSGAKLFNSSCSPEAEVIFIDKDCGYFLKSARRGALEREATLTKWFHTKGLSAEVLIYINDERDWLITKKVPGDDCTNAKYLEHPERLCDILAERLSLLHGTDFSDCPVQNHTAKYLAKAKSNYINGIYDKSLFPDNWGYTSAEEAFRVIETQGHLLKCDILLHGDYCLPNIILDDWKFSGFIDLDSGGVGDRHVDLFWALWTLAFNLKTDKYRQRFMDAYGRQNIDEEMLRVIAAAEVFG